MVRAWYFTDEELDSDRLDKGAVTDFIDLDTLKTKIGVEVSEIPSTTTDVEDYLNTIKKERGFAYDDTLVIKDTEDLREQIRKYATEHLHDEPEIRFVLDGRVYFDIRDEKDDWIRVEVSKGDLIMLPAGIYHRLTLDANKNVTLRRLFFTKPTWTSHVRPTANQGK